MKNKNVIGISPVTLVIAAVLIFMSIGTAMATVWTDQADYPPGSIVTISGNNSDSAGYLPGETVNVHVDGPSSYDSSCSSTVDSSGAWSCYITLASDLSAEGQYNYMATGQTSGVKQSGIFYDSGSFGYNPLTSSLTVTAGGTSGSFTQTVTAPKNNGDFTASLHVAGTGTPIPASWASASPTALRFSTGTKPSGTDDTELWLVTFIVPSGTAAGTYTANIKANPSISGVGEGSGTAITLTVVADNTPPIITPTISGTKGSNGWYTSDVAVSWSVTDPESGIASKSGCDVQILSTETVGTTVTCSATNGAGLSSSSPVTIKIDKTGPSASLSVKSGTPGTNGWYTSDVTVSTTGTDSISDSVACTADHTLSAETTGQIVTGSCTNGAGLTASATPLTIKIDKTGPSASLSVTAGTLGNNGWYTSDVTVSTSGTDSISSTVTCTSDQSQTTETTGTVFNGVCTNDAGLITDAAPLTVKLDKIPPTLTFGTATPAPNVAGWNKDDVSVPYAVDDSYSGVDPTTPSGTLVLTAEGSSVTGTVTVKDNAGNTKTYTSSAYKIDKTVPTITLNSATNSCSLQGNVGWCRGTQTAGFDANDGLSGLADSSKASFTQSTTDNGAVVNIASGQICDVAGNCNPGINAGPYNIDSVAPTISGSRTPAANANGWNNVDVTVHFDCNDATSGVASCTPETTLTGEGSGQSVPGSVVDNAGNTASTTVDNINIDKTPPTITGAATTSPNTNGWYNNDVVVHFTYSDALSGIGADQPDIVLSSEATGLSVTGTVTDKAGNSADYTVSGINIDKTPPTITGSKTPSPNANDWNDADVTVHFDCNDALSGVASCTSDTTVSAEGAGQSVTGIATDFAGNTASITVGDINIDKTPPAITASASTTDGVYTSGTWTNKDVTVSFSCSDDRSGVASCDSPVTKSGEGSDQFATGSVTDKAGNTASATFSGINIDKSVPTITITTPKDGASYTLNQPVVADYSCTDSLSGVATCSGNVPKGNNIDTGSVGTKTFTVNTVDNAGNSGTKSVTYYVKYIFGGILQPINADGGSIFKFGSTVPVKFQLTDYNGNYISTAVATIGMAKIDNNIEGIYVEAISTSAATTGNLFRYDLTNNQYIFNLATRPLSTGTWSIKISINDGVTYTVKISLK